MIRTDMNAPSSRVLKLRKTGSKSVRSSTIKSYDSAIKKLKLLRSGDYRGDQKVYEAILTQIFQKYIRSKGDCVLASERKPWTCGGMVTAGHVFSRSVKELLWDEQNCYPQCAACNSLHRVHPIIFHDWCKEKLGELEYNRLKRISSAKQAFLIPLDKVMEMIETYEILLKSTP